VKLILGIEITLFSCSLWRSATESKLLLSLMVYILSISGEVQFNKSCVVPLSLYLGVTVNDSTSLNPLPESLLKSLHLLHVSPEPERQKQKVEGEHAS